MTWVRQLGTAYVDLHVLVSSIEAANHLVRKFAQRARANKTVTHYRYDIAKRSQFDIVVTIKYRHTCKNGGNTNSDARRFVKSAFQGTTYRWETQLTRPRWKAQA